jgi:hypothetical protein
MMAEEALPSDVATRLESAARREWIDVQLINGDEVRAYAQLHGYDADIDEVPLGYGAVLTMRAVLNVLHDADLALPFDRNVHAAQEIEWVAPMRLGTTVQTRATVGNVNCRERAVFFDVVTVTTNGDDVILRGVATQAVRHG